MRKKSKLNYATVKEIFFDDPLDELDLGYFRINNGNAPIVVKVPSSIMYRLYRIGQAYGYRQLRYLESEVKIIIGSTDLPEFKTDLESVRQLVNDEVLNSYIDQLLSDLASSDNKQLSVSASTGAYY